MSADPYTIHDAAMAILDGAILGAAVAAGFAAVVVAAYVAFVVLRGVWAVLWRVLVAAVLVGRFVWRHAFPPPPPPTRCDVHGWLACPRAPSCQSR